MSTQPAPAASHESLIGVCAAIARDFGFNPLWLRLAFAFGLLIRFDLALIAYGVLGVAVVASRLIAPDRRGKPRAAAPAARVPANEDGAELARAA